MDTLHVPPEAGNDVDGHSRPSDDSAPDDLRRLLRRPDDGVITGLSATIADGLGVDVLWVRLGFVLLLLAGGVGAVLYAGLWFVLVAGDGGRRRWARVFGGVVVVVVVPWMLIVGGQTVVDGTAAIVLLLVGLALALWHPGGRSVAGEVPPRTAPSRPPPPVASEVRPSALTPPGAALGARRSRRPTSPRPDPSLLGRAVVGLAVIVAAAGGLIDQLNGGRTHPEQWLGAAAAVCGLGLLVGAVRGHARWLIVPALLFAAVGFGSGILANAGISLGSATGDGYLYISSGGTRGEVTSEVGFGGTDIYINGVPDEPVVARTRTGVGDVHVSVADDVAVEFRTGLDHGEAVVDGEAMPTESFSVGPDRTPDVIVDVRILYGDLAVNTFDRADREATAVEEDPALVIGDSIEPQPISSSGEVAMTSDGTLIIGEGGVVIAPDNSVISGEWFQTSEREIEIHGDLGVYRLINGVLLTPFDEVLDLARIRAERGTRPVQSDVSETPVTTAIPGNVPITDPSNEATVPNAATEEG